MSAKLIFIVIVFTVWILQGQSVTAANRTACRTLQGKKCQDFTWNSESFTNGTCLHDPHHGRSWCVTKNESRSSLEWDWCRPRCSANQEDTPDDCNVINGHVFTQEQDGLFYYFNDANKFAQVDAEQYCKELGARLAHADTQEQFDVIRSYFTKSEGRQYWIGLQIFPWSTASVWNVDCLTKSNEAGNCPLQTIWSLNNAIIDFKNAVLSFTSYASQPCIFFKRLDTLGSAECSSLTLNFLCQKMCDLNRYGVLTSWSEWQSCSSDEKMESWTQTRDRQCLNPFSPNSTGITCSNSTIDSRQCQEGCQGSLICARPKNCQHAGLLRFEEETRCCQQPDIWTNWTTIRECQYNVSTELWSSLTQRNCTSGKCLGQVQFESIICDPVHGNWSAYSNWTDCTDKCLKYGSRTCTNPSPKYGGDDCSGSNETAQPCIEGPCFANDCFGLATQTGSDIEDFVPWNSLNKTDPVLDCQNRCKTSDTCKSFEISTPLVSDPGCSLLSRTVITNVNQTNNALSLYGPKNCPVHGSWSSFSPWSMCSKKCSYGMMIRYRFCSNPKPKYGGQFCSGHSYELQKCNDFLCDCKFGRVGK